MPVHMCHTVADVIGGRIYLFGLLPTYPESYGILVFDTETQTWEGPMTVQVIQQIRDGCLVVMAGKMYMRNFQNCYVYDPKESKWETDEVLSSEEWENACVVNDVLYFYSWPVKELRVCGPEHKCLGVVEGLDDFLAEMRRVDRFWGVTMSNYAGKLVLFFRIQEIIGEICCV
ncbi:hypothetical protein Bca52824_015362 [Brassica carinata]|uniref:FKB95-like N-terminal Kelch domain-containing protein n=1 Tax=Brassica carinata TaxID=52824 RepID=A0A8X8B341_BRACI|nr:hypothetical protein Bca52824_015362 [Brassica carinata]